MTNRERIKALAVELLEGKPEGLRYTELVALIHQRMPDIARGNIDGTVWNLEVKLPDKICKPARGLYLHAKYRQGPQPPQPPQQPTSKIREEDFYKPFADWLVNELEECTKAIPVGGNKFRDKWGTPDVIGIREARKSDIIKFGTEIVCAEVKLDSANLITAFGQSCAYRLFAHKSYIVVPITSPQDDIGRLDALCRIFGIGLILFNAEDPKVPGFDIRVRAASHEPDMFYVNKSMEFIEDELFS